MAALVDANVLIALLYEGHAHNEPALAWLDGQDAPASVLVCRVVQMAALRIMTSRTILRDDAVSPREFWRGWDRLTGDDRFAAVAEPAGFDRIWREVTGALAAGAVADTDAYLAALALAGEHVLVTFDRGFRRFRGLGTEILAARV